MVVTTLKDILSMKLDERKKAYRVDWIDEKGVEKYICRVEIDGIIFTDYKAFSFLREKSYVLSPERSGDGTIGNLNSYSTFVTPHLKIDFSMMSIDSYREIMNLIYSKNEFVVKCYDIVNDCMTTNKMYFATEEMPKLWTVVRALNGEEWTELLGVQDYTVEMIGTNAELDLLSVVYHSNYPDGTDSTEAEKDVYKGAEVIIGQNSSFQYNPPTNYKFKHWEDRLGRKYTDGLAYTINESIVLYAIWEATENHTLVFNYGYSAPMIDSTTQKEVMSIPVTTGKSIGILPKFETNPSVTYEDKVYDGTNSPYYNGQWYKTTKKVEEGDSDNASIIVKDGDLYWSNYDTTIYLLYDVKSYNVNYYIDGELNSTLSVKYGEQLALPEYKKVGYTFSGWYLDSTYKNPVPKSMPPYAISVYARFVKNE